MQMEIVRGMHNIRPRHRGCVLTIGNFDGVHHGHQVLLAHVIAKGKELGVPSAVVTFEPMPREFFRGTSRPARLTRFREKIMLLCRSGVDRVICLPFNEQLVNVTAETVIDSFLVESLGIRYIVVGDDFRFGCLAGLDHRSAEDSWNLWLPLPAGWSGRDFAAKALERGVIVTAGEDFAIDPVQPVPAVRICLSEVGVARLGRALGEIARLAGSGPGPVAFAM